MGEEGPAPLRMGSVAFQVCRNQPSRVSWASTNFPRGRSAERRAHLNLVQKTRAPLAVRHPLHADPVSVVVGRDRRDRIGRKLAFRQAQPQVPTCGEKLERRSTTFSRNEGTFRLSGIRSTTSSIRGTSAMRAFSRQAKRHHLTAQELCSRRILAGQIELRAIAMQCEIDHLGGDHRQAVLWRFYVILQILRATGLQVPTARLPGATAILRQPDA